LPCGSFTGEPQGDCDPKPFVLHVPDSDIADLRDHLARTRFQAPGDPWTYGPSVDYLLGC